MILTGIMAGIYSGILDSFEVDYGLNQILSALILTILTITTGILLHKMGKKNMERPKENK